MDGVMSQMGFRCDAPRWPRSPQRSFCCRHRRLSRARGPEGIADVAERVIDAVVNISTSQNVE